MAPPAPRSSARPSEERPPARQSPRLELVRRARPRGRISLVLVGDNLLAREGVVGLIRARSGFHILAASAGIEEALETVREIKPDMVLLNLRRKGDDSLTLAGALHGEVPEFQVIIIGVAPLRGDVASFVRAGVSGFLMANASFDTFLSTIHSVAQGMRVLPSELTRTLFGQLTGHGVQGRRETRQDVNRLSTRERAVTDLIVQGLSHKEMAARLRIALPTVTSQVRKVLSKLAVNGLLEVAVCQV